MAYLEEGPPGDSAVPLISLSSAPLGRSSLRELFQPTSLHELRTHLVFDAAALHGPCSQWWRLRVEYRWEDHEGSLANRDIN
jgi:hypothetical protein